MRNCGQGRDGETRSLDGLSVRLSQVVGRSGLNQTEFARKLGVSPGFMSDVIRGKKKPGAEFLYSISTVFSISADWLLTGGGTANGATGIDMTFMKTIQLHIALAKSAIVDNNNMANLLLNMAKEGRLGQLNRDSAVSEFFCQINPAEAEHELAFDIYNSQLWTSDPDAQIKNSLAAALAWFQARKPLDPCLALQNALSIGGTSQIAIDTTIVAGKNFHEI